MKSSRIISCSGRLFAVLTVIATLWTGGCGDFLTDKTASRESNNILDDLGRVETTTEPNIPMPSIYKGPPKIVEQIVGGAPEFKLFYFCRHLSAAELEAIVHKQFATKIFVKPGKPPRTIPDYTVSSVATTNQLIVRCPTREDVEAVLELLQQVDIQPIQVKISCLISEVYADKTLDWETTTAIKNLFGESISAMPSAMPFGQDIVQWLTESDPLAAFPGASMREFGRAKMGLNVGYKSDKFTAVVDILESQGYLKILMNPTLEIINGKTAKVSSSQRVPVDKTYIVHDYSRVTQSSTEWADIVDSLEITPHVFADGYIGLETRIIIGSKLTPEGIKQLPIVTKKEITNKETRIRPGESLIIGGLRKSERRDVLRGVPFLKDIPLIGILFSGRDFEERAVETIFILTPTFSTGGIPRQEMTEEVERKHESPSGNSFTDPLDMLEGKREKERKTKDAEKARTEAEAEKAEARAAVRDAGEQIERAKAGAKTAMEKAAAVEQQAKAETATAKAETATAKADTAKAKADAQTATEKAAATMQQAQTQIEKLTAEAEKLKAETEKAKADLQKATAEAEKAKADAQKAMAEAVKAKADAEKAKKEAEAKAKEETAKEAKEETEQAKTEKPKQEDESKEQG